MPAIIVFSLTERAAADRETTASTLSTLWSTLQVEGLVRHRPVEFWRRRGVADRLELHVLFLSHEAAGSWTQNGAVQEAHGTALDTLLRKPPETQLHHDAFFEEEEFPFCVCSAPSGILASGNTYERHGPLACLDCGGQYPEPDPAPDAEEVSVDTWSWSYSRIYGLWIESTVLERWSAQQVSDPTSELNTCGRAACAALEKNTGVPVYLLIVGWDPDSCDLLSFHKCPACGDPGKLVEAGGERRICVECRLAFEQHEE